MCIRDRANNDLTIPPLVETLAQVQTSLAPGASWRTWVVRDPVSHRLVGSCLLYTSRCV